MSSVEDKDEKGCSERCLNEQGNEQQPTKPCNDELRQLILPGVPADVRDRYANLLRRAQDFSLAALEPEFVILDTETTGFDSRTEALIEVAAVIVRGNETLDTFSTFVNPKRPIPRHITEITNISDTDVADAPHVDEVMRSLIEFCGDRLIIAHNAPFDQAFIQANIPQGVAVVRNTSSDISDTQPDEQNTSSAISDTLSDAQIAPTDTLDAPPGTQKNPSIPLLSSDPWIDTVELARIALPLLREYNLESLSAAFAPESRSTHRAIDDVLALVKVWRVILVGLSDLPEGLCAYLAGITPEQPWGNRAVLKQVAGITGVKASAFDLVKAREVLTRHLREQKKVDATELEGGMLTLIPVESDELAAEYAVEGLLGKMYPEYEARHEQVEMADAVAAALNSSGIAAIEAGTGVGKSMAYLLPLALFAKRNGVTCGVATKSNTLLDQLIYHELPRLSAAMEAQGMGGVEYLSLKGYDHYPCLRKLLRPPSFDRAKAYRAYPALVAYLLSYVCQSVSGDIDAINVRRGDVPRFEFIASAEDCLKHRCRYYRCCLLHSIRRQAKCADIIVTNHALLFCDVMSEGSLLPPVRHWIIDEAHGAESEARKQLSNALEAKTLSEAVRAVLKGGGLVDSIRAMAANLEGGGVVTGLSSKASATAEPTDALTSSFFSAVSDLINLGENSDYNQVELWLNQKVRESAEWGQVVSAGRSLGTHMEKLISELKDLVSALGDTPELSEQQSTLAGHTMVIASGLETLRLILDGTNASYVYSALLDRRTHLGAGTLTASYFNVGEVLAEQFYPNQLSVVYTSATIALASKARRSEFDAYGEASPAADFGYFKRGVGLDLIDAKRTSTLKLDSSYDFDTNMAVFVPTNMLAPNEYSRRGEYLTQLDDLLFLTHKAMGGSVLTLFTNRREMEETYERLRPAFETNGLEVICQYAGTSRTRLREKFVGDEQLSLFALRSFWEGFDAPGDTLRCVIIPKLPFGRPNDPLQREREIREKGAWSRYSLPEAVISLKQAAGRLIRSSNDSGYLVLADSRLVSKFYGKDFLAALPSQNIHYLSIEAIAQRMRTGN